MRHLQIKHITTYEYAETVTLLPHKLLLRPREGHDIRIESAELIIAPAHHLQWQRDVYDNAVAQATFLEPASRLSIGSRVLIQHYDDQPLDFLVAGYAALFPFQYDAAERVDLGPYLPVIFDQDLPLLSTWLRQFWQSGQVVETYLLLEWINKAIATGFTYQQREELGVQTPAATLTKRAGSCRDFATLFVAKPATTWAWRHALSAATSTRLRFCRARAQPTPGRKFTCPAPAGKDSTPLPAKWSATTISPWP